MIDLAHAIYCGKAIIEAPKNALPLVTLLEFLVIFLLG